MFGCTGTLGRLLVNQLGRRGTQVIVPYRGNQEDPRHLKLMGDLGQIVPLRFDPKDPASLMQCVRHSDTVYNLCGRDYETSNFTFDQVHVQLAKRIAQVSRQSGVQRLIHVSSLNVDAPGADRSAFLQSKLEGEEQVRQQFPDAVIVRPGSCYGWEDRMFAYLGETLTHPIKKYFTLGRIPLLEGGRRMFYPVYAGDVARGMYRLMEEEQPQKVYEFVGPEAYSYREFVELFCEYARRPLRTVDLPYAMYRAMINVTQVNPLRRVTVHDIDRWMVDDQLTQGVGRLEDVGVQAQKLESLAITFVRHYRSGKWADEPASIAEAQALNK